MRETIFGPILALYAVSTQVMTLFFWIEYLKEDSFLIALLIDPFLAEFKGLLWPFFI